MNPLPYMNDWNCNAPSSNQINPRTVWTERVVSEKKYARTPALDGAPRVTLRACVGRETLLISYLLTISASGPVRDRRSLKRSS